MENKGLQLQKEEDIHSPGAQTRKIKEACGIVGIVQKGNPDTAHMAYFGLMALQHRGQESAGISVSNDNIVSSYKDMGLVQDVFDDKILNLLRGDMCLGHVRYSKESENFVTNAQPLVVKTRKSTIAIAINGALTNGDDLREQMSSTGVMFTTTTDCEIIAALLAKHYTENSLMEAIQLTMKELKGAYALSIMTEDTLFGIRDESGIRPLSLGELDGGYMLASESVAFDICNATLIRDLAPGEIVQITREGIVSSKPNCKKECHLCSFEYVYFARPDSFMDNLSVYKTREDAGREIAKEFGVEADLVVGVPDSGTPAAIGFSKESGIPYCIGLIKNRYVGRTFIQPTQTMRELSVRLKLNPMKGMVAGKRIVLVDDSIVRGTTSKQIIHSLKQAGATEVHLRVCSPEVMDICHFGIDIPNRQDLISSSHSHQEICEMIGADSLEFLSLQGLQNALGENKNQYCYGCFTGEWPGINIEV